MFRFRLVPCSLALPGKVLPSFCCILTPYLPSAMLEGFWGEQAIWDTLRKNWRALSLLFKHLWELRQSCCLLDQLWLGGVKLSPGPRAAEPGSAVQGSLTLRGACKAVEGDAGCPWEQLWDCAGWQVKDVRETSLLPPPIPFGVLAVGCCSLRRVATVLQLWGPMGHPGNQLQDASLISDPSRRVACVR